MSFPFPLVPTSQTGTILPSCSVFENQKTFLFV
jgi:hypothetical protein